MLVCSAGLRSVSLEVYASKTAHITKSCECPVYPRPKYLSLTTCVSIPSIVQISFPSLTQAPKPTYWPPSIILDIWPNAIKCNTMQRNARQLNEKRVKTMLSKPSEGRPIQTKTHHACTVQPMPIHALQSTRKPQVATKQRLPPPRPPPSKQKHRRANVTQTKNISATKFVNSEKQLYSMYIYSRLV